MKQTKQPPEEPGQFSARHRLQTERGAGSGAALFAPQPPWPWAKNGTSRTMECIKLSETFRTPTGCYKDGPAHEPDDRRYAAVTPKRALECDILAGVISVHPQVVSMKAGTAHGLRRKRLI